MIQPFDKKVFPAMMEDVHAAVTCASLSPDKVKELGLAQCYCCINYLNDRNLVKEPKRSLPQHLWGKSFRCRNVKQILDLIYLKESIIATIPNTSSTTYHDGEKRHFCTSSGGAVTQQGCETVVTASTTTTTSVVSPWDNIQNVVFDLQDELTDAHSELQTMKCSPVEARQEECKKHEKLEVTKQNSTSIATTFGDTMRRKKKIKRDKQFAEFAEQSSATKASTKKLKRLRKKSAPGPNNSRLDKNPSIALKVTNVLTKHGLSIFNLKKTNEDASSVGGFIPMEGTVTIPDELSSVDFNLDAIRSDLMKLGDRLHYNVTLEEYSDDDEEA